MEQNPIIDAFIDLYNHGQDMLTQLDNLSKVRRADGSVHDAADLPGLQWEWRVIAPENVLLATTPHLVIAPVAHLLKNGECLIQLKLRIEASGKTFKRFKPADFMHNLISGQYANYMPYPGSYSAATYREQMDMMSWAAPWIQNMHFESNRPGDLNGDGVVNNTDTLLYLGAYNPQ